MHHSCDVIEYELYQYDERNAPPVPNIAMSDQFAHFANTISAAIANQATEQAQMSPVRTLAYNTLAENNFTNPDFAQVFDGLVGFMEVLQARGDFMRLDYSVVDQATEQFLTMWSSALMYNNPQYLNSLPVELQDAVCVNAGEFQRVMEDIRRLGQPMQRQPIGRQPMGRQAQVGMRGMMSNNIVQPPSRSMRGFGGSAAPTAPSQVPSAFGGSVRSPQGRPNMASRAPEGRTPAGGQRVLAKPEAKVEAPATPVSKTTPAVTGESDMDREQHSIPYLTKMFPMHQPPKSTAQAKLQKTVERIAENPKSIITMGEVTDVSLCECLHTIQASICDKITDTTDIYAISVEVTNPVVSSLKIRKRLFDILNAGTFSDVATAMVKAGAANAEAATNPREAKKEVAWVSQVDRILTEYVNNWLRYCVGGFGEKPIDSFMMDMPDLPAYLLKVHGPAVVNVYNRMQAQMKEVWSRPVEMTGEDTVETAFVSTPYNVFYITELAEGLNYAIGKTITEVKKGETPRLYAMLGLINGSSKPHQRNILLTMDGVRYEFYESAKTSGVFYIREV